MGTNSEFDSIVDIGALRRRVDIRLCTIAGILCSLNLIDSGILSSAAVTTMLSDLDLEGNRFSVSILLFTVASVCFQPATLAVRILGPRLFFTLSTCSFGVITLCTAFVRTYRELYFLRVLLGFSMSGIYPGLTVLISSWYTREEQQLRFAYLQSGEVIILATGSIVNFGLNQLDGGRGLKGWQWMFLIEGVGKCTVGIFTYWWMVDFPEKSHLSFHFLSKKEMETAVARIQEDRADVSPTPLTWLNVLRHFLDLKIYGFTAMFFLLNVVSTALAYFTPTV